MTLVDFNARAGSILLWVPCPCWAVLCGSWVLGELQAGSKAPSCRPGGGYSLGFDPSSCLGCLVSLWFHLCTLLVLWLWRGAVTPGVA